MGKIGKIRQDKQDKHGQIIKSTLLNNIFCVVKNLIIHKTQRHKGTEHKDSFF